MPTSTPAAVVCPECESPVTFTQAPIAGEVCRCASCSLELEVLSAEPITLAPAPEVREDWGE